ncbi:uncharacterized protein LOC136089141 [Hydra vulgaris]|uniref:Ribonucleoside-diphosphate reductase n=1 Tax=Hydra vulgaris TaxID=6087 RepID=A0ABM4D9C2_HYDVU
MSDIDLPAIFVINRNGEKIPVNFDEIIMRIRDLSSNTAYGPPLTNINEALIIKDFDGRFHNGMTTRKIDAELAMICINLMSYHVEYETLAARIFINDLHKRVPESISKTIDIIVANAPTKRAVRFSDEYIGIIKRAANTIDVVLDHSRDYKLNYFGFQTIARYLIRLESNHEKLTILDDQMMERPQHLYMRIAIGIFCCQPGNCGHIVDDNLFIQRITNAINFYHKLSQHFVSNATPIMLNSCTITSQLASCFLISTGDNLEKLLKSIVDAAMISSQGGGVSIWYSNVRAAGSRINSSGGFTNGFTNYAALLNQAQNFANQGGKRPGAFAVYLSVDHDDIIDFLKCARIKGEVTVNAPDLKYALWVSDLFMETLVEQIHDPNAGDWYLFSPDDAPDLDIVYGDEYRNLYKKYVNEKRYRRCVKAKTIIDEAFISWSQIGVPYVLYKDAINLKSNMSNVAPVCSSNLCTEITIPSWNDIDRERFARFNENNIKGGEYGVCNLSAICLENFIVKNKMTGYEHLYFAAITDAAALEVYALNNMINIKQYPTEECRRSNRRHRPIGIGIMGLADVLARLEIPYGSIEAQNLARAIAAVIYYGSMRASNELAKIYGAYESFPGSQLSRGEFQPDLWIKTGHLNNDWESDIEILTSGFITKKDWLNLRIQVIIQGVYNALLTAYMPTATTSNIIGQNECFEPFTSNIYTRKTLAGEFMIDGARTSCVRNYIDGESNGAIRVSINVDEFISG